MKTTAVLAGLAAIAAQKVAAHATFQELWVNGIDMGSTCVRMPNTNSPVTDVTSNDIRCNANQGAPAYKCVVVAGSSVTIEMHQQPGDRSCANEAIGGAHYGPVQAYLSKVEDAATADGSDGWFKVYEDTWASNGASGSDDFWGTKDLNTNCGKLDLKIPADIPAGDYLLRAEAIALHSAGGLNGAQFYISCYQITVTGGGSVSPATVNLPGAYDANDPGLLINIYQKLSTYIAPGPTVVAGGSTAVAGKGETANTAVGGDIKTITGTGAAGAGAGSATPAPIASSKAVTSVVAVATSAPASSPVAAVSSPALSSAVVPSPAVSSAPVSSAVLPAVSSRPVTTVPSGFATSVARPTSSKVKACTKTRKPSSVPAASSPVASAPAASATAGAGSGSCTTTKWGQCGGIGFTGCATCVSGTTCTKQNDYYHQCL